MRASLWNSYWEFLLRCTNHKSRWGAGGGVDERAGGACQARAGGVDERVKPGLKLGQKWCRKSTRES